MKKRGLITTILSIVVMAMLVVFVIGLFQQDNAVLRTIAYNICLPVAILAMFGIDVLLPVLDNYKRFKEDRKLLLFAIIKVVLFIGAFVILFLSTVIQLPLLSNQPFALIAFAILYFVQFFINIDPKRPKAEDSENELESDSYDFSEGEEISEDETFDEEVSSEETDEVTQDDEPPVSEEE